MSYVSNRFSIRISIDGHIGNNPICMGGSFLHFSVSNLKKIKQSDYFTKNERKKNNNKKNEIYGLCDLFKCKSVTLGALKFADGCSAFSIACCCCLRCLYALRTLLTVAALLYFSRR